MEKCKSDTAAPSVDGPRLVLPRSVRVAAFDFDVIEWGVHAANASRRFGEFSSLEMLIRIDNSVAPMKVMDTMLHEINHAIYWAYGMDDADREERIVGTMATAWLQVWRDNPSLVQMLADSIGWQNVQTAPTEEGGKEQL